VPNRPFWQPAIASLCALILLSFVGVSASADNREACVRDFQPSSGQPGKDVVWVPTSDDLVNRMLTMASVEPTDLVYDLGAGDGKIAIAAARDFGARSVGVEYNPEMVKLAQCFVTAEGVADRVTVLQGDIFETDFRSATVVTLYLLPELNVRLRPTILKMKPGTRIVSHSFLMGDWQPDQRTPDSQAYMWIVPANVAGTWTFQTPDTKDAFTVRLKQQFQEISGTAGTGNRSITNASLRGDTLQFAYDDDGTPVKIAARVKGKRIDAKVTRGNKTINYVGTRT